MPLIPPLPATCSAHSRPSRLSRLHPGMAVFDTMRHIRPDVSTVCVGLAASMGAFLLASGHQGKRYSLPNSRIMIHQPLGGAQGQAADIEIQVGAAAPCRWWVLRWVLFDQPLGGAHGQSVSYLGAAKPAMPHPRVT